MEGLWIPTVLAAEMPGWVSAAWVVFAIAGGLYVGRRCSAQEKFAESAVSLGAVGFVALMAVGTLVPGLLLKMTDGTRVLVGLGLALIALASVLAYRERLVGRLAPVMFLLYVALALVVFAIKPALYFSIDTGTRSAFLIGSTFVVPLSLGRLIALKLGMEDVSFRIGVVLTTITLGIWPMAYQLMLGAAEQQAYRDTLGEYEDRRAVYDIRPEIKGQLEEEVSGLTVIYEPGDESSAAKDQPKNGE